MIAAVGELQTRTWEDNGAKRYAVDVNVSETYFTGEKREETYQTMPGYNEPQESPSGGFVDIGAADEDDLPF